MFAETAALTESLIGNYLFVDGNKRTGIAAAGPFLVPNGYWLTATNRELVHFSLACAQLQLSLEEMMMWY